MNNRTMVCVDIVHGVCVFTYIYSIWSARGRGKKILIFVVKLKLLILAL